MRSAPRWTRAQLQQAQQLNKNTPTGAVDAKTVAKPNKKIRNAVKTVVDGQRFDSQLEAYMYGCLKNSRITFETQKEFVLIEKFQYRGKWVRPMVKIVDFWLPDFNIVLDTKGFASDVYKVKEKLLKLVLKRDYGIEPKILTPSNRKECDAVVLGLLTREDMEIKP